MNRLWQWRRSHERRPIIHQERVYADVFPLVRLYQGFWLGAVVLFGLMFLIPVFFWRSYLETLENAGIRGMGIAGMLGANLLILTCYLASSLWISVSVCRMSRWVGAVLFAYCIPALCFATAILVFAVGAWITAADRADPFLWRFVISIALFVIPFGYFCIIGLLAGRRFAFSGDETRLLVSEIDTRLRAPEWVSTALCLPVPLRHLKKKGLLPTILFVLSGAAFACFGVFAPFVFGFAAVPVMLLGLPMEMRPTVPAGGELAGFMFFAMRYLPVIFVGLAAGALIVGVAARVAGRRRAIDSMLESQLQDPRSPVLFLRSFHDDQVGLPAPRLPLLGRLVNLFQARTNLDIILVEEGTAYGPVVAVGKPEDPEPPYGASRGYFEDGTWKDAVSRMADDSRAIIICLDGTDGVLWELEHIVKCGHTHKTLFLIHPGRRDQRGNRVLVHEVVTRIRNISQEQFDLAEVTNSDGILLGFFFDEKHRAKAGLSHEFSGASYLLMTRWFLRTVIGIPSPTQLQPFRERTQLEVLH